MGNCGRVHLGAVPHQISVLDYVNDVCPVLPQGLGLLPDAGGTDHDGVYLLSARRIGSLAGGGDCLERYLPKAARPRFGKREEARHQSTLASVWRRRSSSGTASAPSPMIRPGGRSGGSSIRCTVRLIFPSWAGLVSSGFFFAAIMPFNEASRGRAMPSSIVRTAGSGNCTVSEAPSRSRRAVPPRFSIWSCEIPVTHGRSSSSAVIGPTVPLAVSVAIRPNRIKS